MAFFIKWFFWELGDYVVGKFGAGAPWRFSALRSRGLALRALEVGALRRVVSVVGQNRIGVMHKEP